MGSRFSFKQSQLGFPRSQGGDGDDDADATVIERSIGDFIRETRKLTDEQIEQILAHQKEQGIRFGEAAVALRLASPDDVIWALSQQFRYPYVPETDGHENPELVVAASPFSDEAEIFRELRSQLLQGPMGRSDTRRPLSVISPDVGDGKTYVAANLAIALSQLGGRTLLVDADMRTPRVRSVFDVSNSVAGLSSILSGRAERRLIQQAKRLPSLYVMPSGPVPPNPQELLQGRAFTLLMTELQRKFDYVVVDSPALVHGGDANIIASQCGTALVLGRQGKTRMDRLQTLVSGLERASVTVAGVVMNRR